ncbi:hypothetical protein BKA70DRAFT_1403739 [Coprinopsis sp. MPI-PUGE-AT-0042]|nr:hypothetical protein BKA70DRAFT_1403739 [Coprinopsis sp. MPI-PUGE-AT-0042]
MMEAALLRDNGAWQRDKMQMELGRWREGDVPKPSTLFDPRWNEGGRGLDSGEVKHGELTEGCLELVPWKLAPFRDVAREFLQMQPHSKESAPPLSRDLGRRWLVLLETRQVRRRSEKKCVGPRVAIVVLLTVPDSSRTSLLHVYPSFFAESEHHRLTFRHGYFQVVARRCQVGLFAPTGADWEQRASILLCIFATSQSLNLRSSGGGLRSRAKFPLEYTGSIGELYANRSLPLRLME